MSTLNLQVKLKDPEHLSVFTAVLQPGVPQEVFETDATSAFQVGYFLVGLVCFAFDSERISIHQSGFLAPHLIFRLVFSFGI